VLLLGGIVRGRDDLHSGATAWVYVGGTVAVVALLGWLLLTMSLRRTAAPYRVREAPNPPSSTPRDVRAPVDHSG
jgi:hypothetical protein